MSDYKTQIVVIAGGPSGLSAAVQAAEDGAEVIVVEKAAAIGGAANMGMGPLGIGTRYQKQQMEDITVEKAFNMFMEYTHYNVCLLYTSPSPRDLSTSRMPSSA